MRFDASLVTWLLSPELENHWGSTGNYEIDGNAYEKVREGIGHYGCEGMCWKLDCVAFME